MYALSDLFFPRLKNPRTLKPLFNRQTIHPGFGVHLNDSSDFMLSYKMQEMVGREECSSIRPCLTRVLHDS